MPIDTSIYSQIQQPKIDSPLNMLAQASQIKNMQNQGRLADIAIQQHQLSLDQTNALNNAYKNALSPDGSLDQNKLFSAITQSGYGSQLPVVQKSLIDAQLAAANVKKTNADATKSSAEALVKATAAHRDDLWNVTDPQAAAQWIAAGYADPITGPVLQRTMPLADAIARIPSDPAAFHRWWQQAGLGATEFIKRNTVDANTAANNATSRANNAATNATTMRGQNMTDARTREAAAQGKIPTGYRQNPDGTLSFIPGGPADPNAAGGKAPTEFQGKSAAFGARAEAADKIISDLSGKYSPAAINSKMSVESAPLIGGMLGAATNKMALSPNDQRAEQAQRDFINAVLRQESGAAISPSEFDNARKQYFPQPGDSKEVIAQKAANRQTAIQGFKNSAGRAAFNAPPAATSLPSGWSVQEH